MSGQIIQWCPSLKDPPQDSKLSTSLAEGLRHFFLSKASAIALPETPNTELAMLDFVPICLSCHMPCLAAQDLSTFLLLREFNLY